MQRVHIRARSNDARSINLCFPASSSIPDVRRKIAYNLGFPIASAPSMRFRSSNLNERVATLADLDCDRFDIIVENGTDLSPKLAFDIGQILKHWLSPALSSRPAYRAALTSLKDMVEMVMVDAIIRHNYDSTLSIRVFSRVTRGLELLKKLGFNVTATSIRGGSGADLRLFEVVRDHVGEYQATVSTATRPDRRPVRSAAVQRRRRRLREIIDMGYEFLVRLENVRIRLEEDTLQALPLQVIDENSLQAMQSNGNTHCTICLEEFAVQDTIMRLPCLHIYHKRCGTSWFHQSRRCPNDMLEVTTDCKRA